MSLMISVSGIRGVVGESLTPDVLLRYATGFAMHLRARHTSPKIVVGRDTRPTGETIQSFVQSVLMQYGCNVINAGIVPTPTVATAVLEEKADGGIVITASHNPVEWNALKFLNHTGEFVTPEESRAIYAFAEQQATHEGNAWNSFGMLVSNPTYIDSHIKKIIDLPFIQPNLIASQRLKILVDAVNGAGSDIIPLLCERLGIKEIIKVACKTNRIFPRHPEPIEENLTETMALVHHHGADLGIVVDPDADRVCFICEDGTAFGEEYSLVACADFILSKKRGSVVNNLSSSRALRDIANKHGVSCYSSKVGEAHVVALMKEKQAVIGGEGSGGIILPELHYGRDAMVGTAIFLQSFSEWRTHASNSTLSAFKKTFPEYYMAKSKLVLNPHTDFSQCLKEIKKTFKSEAMTEIDGTKIDLETAWIHIRKSNTEPIVRIYTEAKTKAEAENLATSFASMINT